MPVYKLKDYQKGFEAEQVRIGFSVARDWIWPYAYNLPDLLKIHAQPDFDPDTRHYCFSGEVMVGTIFSTITPLDSGGVPSAVLDFPRVLPGHEDAAGILMKKALETLQKKGIHRVTGRVTTMLSDNIRLAEQFGFSIADWGYKAYYAYEMIWGKLQVPSEPAEVMDPDLDLRACADLAARWYGRPAEWCRTLLQEWHAAGILTHAGVHRQGNLVASCMAARNDVRPTTAAIYYIFTPDAEALKALLTKVINVCVDQGVDNLIADVINDQRAFEHVYQELGFQKVAEWARCEKMLD